MSAPRIAFAHWISLHEGLISLTEDWPEADPPPLFWGPEQTPVKIVNPVPPLQYGEVSGYYLQGRWATFVLCPEHYTHVDVETPGVYVAGPFSGWGEAQGDPRWRLVPALIGDRRYFLLNVDRTRHGIDGPTPFKFVLGNGHWLLVPGHAPSTHLDEHGNNNFLLNPAQSGDHLFRFRSPVPLQLAEQAIIWLGEDEDHREYCNLIPGPPLLETATDLPLGARSLPGGATVFRLFAPRASQVEVVVRRDLQNTHGQRHAMRKVEAGTWEVVVNEDLDGAYYHYHVDSQAADSHSHFDASFPLLDPYAQATVGPAGPGIILSPSRWREGSTPDRFRTPAVQDLVIVEAHVRDLLAKAPFDLSEDERLGFTGLTKFVAETGNYLKSLGVNAVELLPLHQFDSEEKEEYHWGYMTTNFFAPCSHYARDPAQATGIGELRALVRAFHQAGLAVIVDVVYNHVGNPNHLMYVDKHYYFDLAPDGSFMNWSGTGNTTRSDAPMVRRLIADSLKHYVTMFGVDGFRFDLGELIGPAALREVGAEVRSIKPDTILIAEPWSFRGNIVHQLHGSGYASWNDGFREFVRDYATGHGNFDGIRYFLRGSPGGHASRPAESVNYVQSHDDYAWIDRITENPHSNGQHPTDRDQRRTRLAGAIILTALGIPMLAGGMDFFHSKDGVRNTYQRGDLNALDYERLEHYRASHEFFAAWVRFRLSPEGRALRLAEAPEEGYTRAFGAEGSAAIAMIFNADRSRPGVRQVLFAANPEDREVTIATPGMDPAHWGQVATGERFLARGDRDTELYSWGEHGLVLPPESVGLWLEDHGGRLVNLR